MKKIKTFELFNKYLRDDMNMISDEELIQDKINESPDLYYDPRYSEPLEWNSTEYFPVTFGWYEDILYTKRLTKENQRRAGHYNLHTGNDVHIAREDWNTSGRLWLKTKVISFWEYPSVKELPILLKELERKLNINILNDTEWKIEIYVDSSKIGRKLVNVKGYIGSDPIPPEEKARQHIDSPMLKTKSRYVNDNMGSKKQKLLSWRQAMYTEGKEELNKSLRSKLKGKPISIFDDLTDGIIENVLNKLLQMNFFDNIGYSTEELFNILKEGYKLMIIDLVNIHGLNVEQLEEQLVIDFEENWEDKEHFKKEWVK